MQLPKQWVKLEVSYDNLARLGADEIYISVFDKYNVSRKLLCVALKISKLDLIKKSNENVTDLQKKTFFQYIQRFNNHEPLSRIEGVGHFYGYNFKISPDTLDPRPETEILINLLKDQCPDLSQPLNIIDIGTGSGCIGIVAAKLYKNSTVTAIDISHDALMIAQENAENLTVKNIDFQLCDDNLVFIQPKLYDVILCNPPYIPKDAMSYLDESVKNYDPKIALIANDNGLYFYDLLSQFSKEFLEKKGSIFIEFGIGQAKCIRKLFKESGFQKFYTKKDDNLILRSAHIQF